MMCSRIGMESKKFSLSVRISYYATKVLLLSIPMWLQVSNYSVRYLRTGKVGCNTMILCDGGLIQF
jgi:hypothetical protein